MKASIPKKISTKLAPLIIAYRLTTYTEALHENMPHSKLSK